MTITLNDCKREQRHARQTTLHRLHDLVYTRAEHTIMPSHNTTIQHREHETT